jgi:hypothetical protein
MLVAGCHSELFITDAYLVSIALYRFDCNSRCFVPTFLPTCDDILLIQPEQSFHCTPLNEQYVPICLLYYVTTIFTYTLSDVRHVIMWLFLGQNINCQILNLCWKFVFLIYKNCFTRLNERVEISEDFALLFLQIPSW